MSNDCTIIVDLWTNWGKNTTVDRTHPTACCKYFDSYIQSPNIEGVFCTSDGNVTAIQWQSLSLSGPIPDSIGNLTSLEFL